MDEFCHTRVLVSMVAVYKIMVHRTHYYLMIYVLSFVSALQILSGEVTGFKGIEFIPKINIHR